MANGLFASENLAPAWLEDGRKFKIWRDAYNENFGARDFARATDRQFSARFEFKQFEALGVGAFSGTINYAGRSAQNVRADGKDGYFLLLNTRADMIVRQRGRESLVRPDHAALVSFSEPAEFRGCSENSWYSVTIPQRTLLALAPRADDLLACPIDPNGEAFNHLRDYIKLLLRPDGVPSDSTLGPTVAKYLGELIALSISREVNVADTANVSGVRAARLRAVIAEIEAAFADPVLSPSRVAARLRLSRRYIHSLLAQTGASFSERVMEARLRRAHAMLADRINDHLSILEIAYRCGFSEASYFNRAFRRRFDATPGDVRRQRDTARNGVS